MRPVPRYGFIVLVLLSSFLMGFTYQDVAVRCTHTKVARVLPAPLASILGINKAGLADLQPVEAYCSVYLFMETSYYGDNIQPKQITYEAVRGMLAALGDRYTRFLDPEEYQQMQQENRGDFEGIGAELDIKEGRIFVKKPLPNSPASRAGIMPNDIILKVNDELIQGKDITEVVRSIRGPRGTKVKLTIKREIVPDLIELEIVRDVIPFTIVESKMEDEQDKIGYIALRQFNEKADQQFAQALTELESKGLRALILDLRGNPGGLLDSAVNIGSRFIKEGNVVIIQDKGGSKKALKVVESKHDHPIPPLVVLIDHRSASASEIVAGAIQNHKTGTLVGTETFGKGLVQTIIALEGDPSAVAITTAKYLTPNGQDVTKNKIHPDVVVEPSEEDLKNDNDVQLKRAVLILKEHLRELQANSKKPPIDKT